MNTIVTASRSEQVKASLVSFIQRNKLQQGDAFPSEADMAKKLGVSRNTIREAYIALESQGIIIRRHGIGTFLARVPTVAEMATSDFISYPHQIIEAGLTPSFKQLAIEYRHPPAGVCELFEIPESGQLLCVERIILADGIPTVYLIDYLSPQVKKESAHWDQFTGNMIDLLSNEFGFNLAYMNVKYRAVLADQEISANLGLAEGLPIIMAQSTLFSLDNELVACGFSYLNPNIFELEIMRVVNPKRRS